MASEDDDEVGVYADDKHAALITDDRALSRLRRTGVFGQVIEVRGRKPDAPDIVRRHLPAILERLERHREVVITVSDVGAWITGPSHLREPTPTVQPAPKRRR